MTFRWRVERASRGRARPVLALTWWGMAFALVIASPLAQAEPVAGKFVEVDTEHMFGFTEGSEIGEKGETEFMSETTGHFGKSRGSYSQVASTLEAKYTLTDRFRVSGAATFAYYDISGVPGMDDRRQASVQSISFGARYRLLDHQQAPFALTLSAEPRRGFVDEWTGAPADEIGAVFAALVDRELIHDRLYAAFDLSYEPERTRPEISRQATFGVGAAVTGLTAARVFVGVDVRYFRQYDGLPLNAFAGQALYLGPTFYANLGPHALISAAWETQVWGAVSGALAGLDLVHFDRHQVRLRLAVSF